MDNNIKKLNKPIVCIEIPELEILKIKDIQFVENFEFDKITLIIIC